MFILRNRNCRCLINSFLSKKNFNRFYFKNNRKIHGSPGTVDSNNNKRSTAFKTIKKILPYLWPKDKPELRKKVMISIAFLVIAKILNVITPYIFKLIIDKLNENRILNDFDVNNAIKYAIFSLIFGYGLARFGASLFNELKNSIFAHVSQRSIRQVSNESFKHMQDLDLTFHLNKQTGMVSKSIDRGKRGVSYILTAMAFNILPTMLEISMVSAMMGLYFGPMYSLTTLGCMGVYGLTTYGITRWRTKYRIEMNIADNESGSKAFDSIINYETVKYFNNEKFERDQYDKILVKYENASTKTISSLSLLNICQNAVFTTGLVSIMSLGVNGVFLGGMTVGDLVMLTTLLFQLSIPLSFLGSTYRDIRQATVDLENLFDLMKIDKTIKNNSNAIELKWPSNLKMGDEFIRFDNVSFAYDDRIVLKNVSFSIPYGKRIALVGGSGSGKSTIVRLLYRFWDPKEGSITVFGKDYRDYTLESLRRVISIIPQDQVLFHNTIMYNIRYGNIKANDDQVVLAAKMAGLHDSIMKFPNGYESQVGERGLKLSGGEKQRVAFARAILKNSPFLIFDEATSSLDSITEKKIMRILSSHFSNTTSVMIAHRLSTIVSADEILVLENGEIVERGKHIDLLINDPFGPYSKLWNKQQEIGDVPKTESIEEDIRNCPNEVGCPRGGCCSK